MEKLGFLYSKAIKIYKSEGISALIKKSILYISSIKPPKFLFMIKKWQFYIYTIVFVLLCNKSKENIVVIVTRNSFIHSGIIDIIEEVEDKDGLKLHIHTKNVEKFHKYNKKFVERITSEYPTVEKIETIGAISTVSKSDTFITFTTTYETNVAYMSNLITSGKKNKNILDIPDGVVTKTTSIITPSDYPRSTRPSRQIKKPSSAEVTYVAQPGVDRYRVAAHTGVPSPSLIRCVGMPRFRRANKIKDGKRNPIIPKTLNEKFQKSSGDTRILVGLTKNKKQGSDLYNMLDQIDMSFESVENILKQQGASLWIKEHQNNIEKYETKKIKKEKINKSDHVFLIEPYEGRSTVDLSFAMDGIITDISSIYVDFLPANIPIGFINHDYWRESYRLSYPEVPFYPGRKISNCKGLKKYIKSTCNDGCDEWNEERYWAEKILIGDGTDEMFWTKVLDYSDER